MPKYFVTIWDSIINFVFPYGSYFIKICCIYGNDNKVLIYEL